MKRVYLLLSAVLAIVSCQHADMEISLPDVSSPEEREVIITASITDAAGQTRTSFNESEGKNYWSAGDKIKVFSAGEAAEFTSMNTEPETIVKFRGYIATITGSSNDNEDSKDYVWGLYPYTLAASYSEPDGISRTARLIVDYTDRQTGVAGTFGDNLAVMIGRSESLAIPFRGAYSGAFFQVNRDDIVSMTLEGLNGEVLAGTATIGLNDNLLPAVYDITDPKTAVTVTAPDGTFEPGKNYYMITLPDVALPNGYKVTLRRSDGYQGTYELRANRPLNRLKFRNLSEPIDARIENEANITAGISTGWVEEFVAIEDPIFKTYLIESFDLNSDGEISAYEAEKIESISVSNCGISSLKGIERMPNLKYLSCGSNQLTTLDVSDCTNLQSLQCSSNQLSTLDVSNNPNLSDLNCSSNQLVTLDVSNDVSLIFLLCQENKLATLDVSNNQKLEMLNCSSNPLANLYMAQGQEISGIYPERDEEYIPAETQIIVAGGETDVPGIVSLGFVPQATIGGTLGFYYRAFVYNPLYPYSARYCDSEDERWLESEEGMSVIPSAIIQYHVNGTNCSLDDSYEYSFILSNTASEFSMAPAFVSYADGVLSLEAQFSGKEVAEVGKTPLFALKIKKGDFSIVSDYATLKSNEFGNMRLACPKVISRAFFDCEDLHYRRGTAGISGFDEEAFHSSSYIWTNEFDYEHCDTTVNYAHDLDLKTIVSVHCEGTNPQGSDTTEFELTEEEMEELGLSYSFELVKYYYLGVPLRDQSNYVTLLDGHIFSPSDGLNSVGYTPIVRVKLMHGDDIVQVAYLKVGISK